MTNWPTTPIRMVQGRVYRSVTWRVWSSCWQFFEVLLLAAPWGGALAVGAWVFAHAGSHILDALSQNHPCGGAVSSYLMEELLIGKVIKSHGIRGEVVVDPTTDEPGRRFAVGTVVHGTQGPKEHELRIDAVRPHKGRLLIMFEGITDRTTADSLRGTHFFAPPLENDDDEEGFYDHELEGLAVIHDGQRIGEVTGVMHGPAGEILEVELSGGKQALIPFVHAIVPDVNLDEQTITITPPDGLLDL